MRNRNHEMEESLSKPSNTFGPTIARAIVPGIEILSQEFVVITSPAPHGLSSHVIHSSLIGAFSGEPVEVLYKLGVYTHPNSPMSSVIWAVNVMLLSGSIPGFRLHEPFAPNLDIVRERFIKMGHIAEIHSPPPSRSGTPTMN